MTIKKGDKVKIIKGKDAGKEGKILTVLKRSDKVVVEGLNLRVKHQRPKKQGEKGVKLQIPAPLARANVMLVCPKCGKATRIGHALQGDKKVRMCKKCKSSVD
jgi:large subunit ribosomal protein L24